MISTKCCQFPIQFYTVAKNKDSIINKRGEMHKLNVHAQLRALII